MLRAIGDRVIVRPMKTPDRTPGGLLIPESAQQTSTTSGYVLSAGEDAEVSSCQTVLFSKFAGVKLESDGEELVVLRTDEILAVSITGGATETSKAP